MDYIEKSEELREILDSLLEEKENQEIEFKSAKCGFPGSFWETYSSFANTAGGVIVFGVSERHGIFSADPLSEELVLSFKKKFFDLQKDTQKVNTALLTDKDVAVIKYDNGYILAFFIPRASREQRPVYIGQNAMTGTYRRNYEGDYICD